MHSRQLPDELYRKAFDQTEVGMGFIGKDGRWIAVNPSLCKLLDYPEARLLAMNWRDLSHGEDLDAELAQVQALVSGASSSYSIRKRCICGNGSTIEVLVHVTMARSDETGCTFFIVQLLDLPRMVAEEEARRQREKIRLLVENVSDARLRRRPARERQAQRRGRAAGGRRIRRPAHRPGGREEERGHGRRQDPGRSPGLVQPRARTALSSTTT